MYKRVDVLERFDEGRHQRASTRQIAWRTPSSAVKSTNGSLGRTHTPGELVELCSRTVRQKHGTRLRPELDDVPSTIVFLVLPRALVLPDDVAVVLGERIARRHAGLAVPVRIQMVEIQRRVSFLHHGRVALEGPVSFGGSAINDVAVGIGAGRQVDLGPRHVQKAQRAGARQGARFLDVDDVVGNGRDMRRGGRIGANSTEGSDDSHREPSIIEDSGVRFRAEPDRRICNRPKRDGTRARS